MKKLLPKPDPDEPDFNIKPPTIEWVSYGPPIEAPMGILFCLIVFLLIVVVAL